MDPTAAVLIMGLEQAGIAAGADQGQPARERSAGSLLDRPSNEPLLRLEGDPVRLDLVASAWLARLRGQSSLGPASTTRQDLNTTWGMDSMEGAFQGDLSLMWRNWTLRLTGSEFSTDATSSAAGSTAFGTTTFAAGDSMRSSFDFYSWGIDVQSWLWRPLSRQQFPWQAPVDEADAGGDLQLVAIVGGRGFGVRQEEQNCSMGTASSYAQTFGTVTIGGGVDVMVDLRSRVGFLDRLEFSATGSWGPMWPGSEGSFFEVRAQLVAWLTGNAGVLFGYRYTGLDFSDGAYSFGGDVAGLVVGGQLRF